MSELERLPQTPPLCLSRGTECIGCPFANSHCEYLEQGIAYVSALAIKHAAKEKLLQEREDNREAREDQIIPGFLTKYGVKSLIRTDEAFRREFIEGNIGFTNGDVTGLKAANAYGLEVGNKVLRESGNRLITSGLRTRDCNGRTPRKKDIGMRNNQADELVAIIRDVSPDQLAEVAKRQMLRFSPQRAIVDSQAGVVPIMMSFSYLHRSEIDLPSYEDPIRVFDAMLKRVDELHVGQKKAQYAEMYELVQQKAPEAWQKPPEDERMIARAFYDTCCPNYAERELELLSNLP